MKKNLNWPAVVAWARNELKQCLEEIEAVDFSEHDAAVSKLSDELKELEKSRPETQRRLTLRNDEFELCYSREAFYAGLSPDGKARHPIPYNQPYNQELRMLSQQAYQSQVAFDALGLHVAFMVSDGRPLVAELRMFIIDLHLNNRERPKRSRGYKVENQRRDKVICWVIADICDRFSITATRNDESKAGPFSACDAIAEAMVALRRKPHSYAHVKDIWLSTDAS